ncbi:MAG TPA: hypothetical protein VGD49_03090 [Longimicrobiales bacterium]
MKVRCASSLGGSSDGAVGAHRGHGATRGAAFATTTTPLYEGLDSKRRDAHEHGGRLREGRAARVERCAAISAGGGGRRCTEAPTAVGGAGVKGRFRAAPLAESGDCRARFDTSALRGGSVWPETPENFTAESEERGASVLASAQRHAAHPSACPHTEEALTERVAGTRRFSAGPANGTRSGAAACWAALLKSA